MALRSAEPALPIELHVGAGRKVSSMQPIGAPVYEYVQDIEVDGEKRRVVRLATRDLEHEGWTRLGIGFYSGRPEDGCTRVNEFVRHQGTEHPEYAYSPEHSRHGWRNLGGVFWATVGAADTVRGVRAGDQLALPLWLSPSTVPARLTAGSVTEDSMLVTPVDPANWMRQQTDLHDLPLGSICLPGSHDSGTYSLSDVFTETESPELAAIAMSLQEISAKLESTGVGALIDLPGWLESNARDAVKALAMTTRRSVADQLAAGVRAFDFRVYYSKADSTFYSVHGLLGVDYQEILKDIAAFAEAHPGEVIFLNFGNEPELFNMKTQDIREAFAELIIKHLKDYLYSKSENPFGVTYSTLVGEDNPKTCIIVEYKHVNTDKTRPSYFWTQPRLRRNAEWSPTSERAARVAEQHSAYMSSMGRGGYFHLGLALTPDRGDYIKRVGLALAPAVAKLGAWTFLIPFYGLWVAALVEAVAASLAIGDATLDWATLEDLSQKINKDLRAIVVNDVVGTSTYPISALYIDYFENTRVLDLAIDLSLRSAKSSVHLPGVADATSHDPVAMSDAREA